MEATEDSKSFALGCAGSSPEAIKTLAKPMKY